MLTATGDLFGRLIRLVTRSSVNHAAVHVEGHSIVEMDPSGAADVGDNRYPNSIWFRPPGTPEQLAVMSRAAWSLYTSHVGYSWVDITAQLLWRVFHVRPKWLARFISSDRRMVCSQSVDWCAQQAGIQLFNDGRLRGLVSPGDLLAVALVEKWPTILQRDRPS